MKLTRRTLLGAAAASRALPQGRSAVPGEELQAARENLRRSSQAMAKVKLPMATEPAFQFKA